MEVLNKIEFRDMGRIAYKEAWDLQEQLLQENIQRKNQAPQSTRNFFLFCEHPPVYTLGRNGKISNLLLKEEALKQRGIEFYHINRGGDITFHGPGQVVVYPILDLERLEMNLARYLFLLEELIIQTLSHFHLQGERLQGERGVWLDAQDPVNARKICAMGIRCSRWITMHGLALNVNTDMDYFNAIIPCGIQDKRVTSMQAELKTSLELEEVKELIKSLFIKLFPTS